MTRLENLAISRQATEKRQQDFQTFSTFRDETHATAMEEGIIVKDKSGRVVENIAYYNRSGTCEEVDWAIPPLRTNEVLGSRPLYPEHYEGPTPAVGDECLIMDWQTGRPITMRCSTKHYSSTFLYFITKIIELRYACNS